MNEQTKTSAARAAKVPVFSLYGEASSATDGEFLHIEEIVTRSAVYNWEIAPHTHRGMFQLLFLLDGRAEVALDGARHEQPAPAVVSVPAGCIHGFHFHPGAVGYVLTLAEARIFTRPSLQSLLAPLLAGPLLLDAAPEIAGRLRNLLGEISIEFNTPLPGRTVSLEGLVAAVLTLMARLHLTSVHAQGPASAQIELVHRLQAEIEARFLSHAPVSHYASALAVTESRLNRACRAIAGCSPLELIQNRLLLEARRKLTYIAAPVATLAYELGFEDPAYFWRFFKRHTGMTPSEFRELGG
jgi:AraC family transcriptional activator of pobA